VLIKAYDYRQLRKTTSTNLSLEVRHMTVVEFLLVAGTLGICTGVWTTLVVIVSQNRRANDMALNNARPKIGRRSKKDAS